MSSIAIIWLVSAVVHFGGLIFMAAVLSEDHGVNAMEKTWFRSLVDGKKR